MTCNFQLASISQSALSKQSLKLGSNRNKLIRALVALLVLPTLSSAATRPLRLRIRHPRDITSVTYLASGEKEELFAADPQENTIYVLELSRGPAAEQQSDWVAYLKAGDFKAPSEIINVSNKLVVLDIGASTLFEINPESKMVSRFCECPEIRQPTAMAIDDDNHNLYIFDKKDRSLYRVGIGSKTPQKMASVPGVDPERIEIAGDSLYWLADHKVYVLRLGQAGAQPHKILEQARTLSVYRGVLYVVSDEAIYAYATVRNDLTPYAVPLPFALSEHHTVIAVDSERLLVVAQKNAWLAPRPLPSLVTYNDNTFGATAKFAALQDYLLDNQLLQTSSFTADREYSRLSDWLATLPIWKPLPSDRMALGTFANVICRLNPNFCSVSSDDSTRLLSRTIPTKTTLTFPGTAVRSSVSVGVAVPNDTVQEYLNRLGIEVGVRNEFSAEYLWRINEQLLNTLESHLSVRDFTLTSDPHASIAPGSVIVLSNGRETVAKRPADCSMDITSRPVSYIPGPVKVSLYTLGILTGLDAGSLAPNFDFAEVLFETPEVSSLTDSQNVAACASAEAALPGSYLIWEVITARSMKVRLTKNGRTYFPSEKTLIREASAATVDPNKDWSLVIPRRVTVAYRAGPLEQSVDNTSASPSSTKVRVSPWDLKPNGPQDIERFRNQALYLPLIERKAELLLPATAASDLNSKLNTSIGATEDSLRYYPRDTLTLQPQAAVFSADSGSAVVDLKDAVTHNRSNLLRQINVFVPDGAEEDDMVVGLMEDPHSTPLHPDLVDDDGTTTAFMQANGETQLVEGKAPANLERARFVDGSFKTSDEHGIHLAGILASRDTNSVPGVVPGSKVFIIATANQNGTTRSIAQIREDLFDAFKRFVPVVNVSQAIQISPDDEKGAEELKLDLKNPSTLGAMLIVVAAGDEGLSVDSVPKRAFISWAPSLRNNIIGVGAVDSDRKFIRKCKWKPTDETDTGCSNFGSAYVQLLAPGQWIFSTGKDSHYVQATGTSMAAPQVAAAAALLSKTHRSLTAAEIKARLIYTANFRPDYVEANIWGGELNVERALVYRNDEEAVLTIRSVAGRKFVVALPKKKSSIKLTQRGKIIPDGVSQDIELGPAPSVLQWSQILRLQREPADDTYWVVYIETNTNRLRIAKDVKFDLGSISCKGFHELKLPSLQDTVPTDAASICTEQVPSGLTGIPLRRVENYVAPPPPPAFSF